MRRFFTLLILLLIANVYCIGQITIEGKIHNYDGKTKLHYYPTLEGIHTSVWKTIQPNPSGEFRIKYKNDGYGTTIISFKRLNYRFFHDANSTIRFEFDQNKIKLPDRITKLNPLEERRKGNYIVLEQVLDSLKQEATFIIEGDYADVNNFYNTNLRSSHSSLRDVNGTYYSYIIRNTSRASEAMAVLDSLIQLEYRQINILGSLQDDENKNSKTVNNDIKEFLKNEVRSFYSGVLLSGMFLKRRDQLNMLLWNPDTALTVYNRHWEKLIEFFVDDLSENIVPSANSFDLNELVQLLCYTQEEYQKYDTKFQTKSLDAYILEALLNPDSTILDSTLILDEKSVLAHRLQALQVYFYSQTFYSPTLLDAYNELKIKYPNSVHIIQFEPEVEKVKAYLKSSAEKFDKAEIIETNYYRFEDLLELFKGQNLLVDIWATWCSPCIQEFKYKENYKPFVKSGDLTVLYISIDKQRWEKKWRDNIKYNQLEGYHVHANNVLIKDMWEFIGGSTGAIPRYVLINENGKIFINDSARPSQKDLLEKQIKQLLSSMYQ
jgi:thiol-disulfide isomerase/thioredoxin